LIFLNKNIALKVDKMYSQAKFTHLPVDFFLKIILAIIFLKEIQIFNCIAFKDKAPTLFCFTIKLNPLRRSFSI